MKKDMHETPGHSIDATVVLEDTDRTSMRFESAEAPVSSCSESFDARFQEIGDFAKGGVGRMSKARDISFGRIVAVKSLKDEFKDDPAAINSFINECSLNARLDHPSIVPVYAMGKGADGGWHTAMKYIHGTPLDAFISKLRKNYDNKKVSPYAERHALTTRLEYFLKICEVIEYCHSMGIVHGDLKPANIILGSHGEVYLLDWGCSLPEGEKPKRISGTPNYMPGEFLKTGVVSKFTDIFALGMILFELSTLMHGRQKCPCSNAEPGSAKCHGDNCLCVNEPETYRHYMPGVKLAPRLKAIILKALAPDASSRYQDVKDLARDVRSFIYNEEVSASPDSPFRKITRLAERHRAKTISLIASVILLLVSAILYSAYRSAETQRVNDKRFLQKLRLQSYTDILNSGVTNNFLRVKGQLLLFADNIFEEHMRPDTKNSSAAHKSGTASVSHPYFPNPVSFDSVSILETARKKNTRAAKPDETYCVRLCRKILSYDIGSGEGAGYASADTVDNNIKRTINRLIILWDDGTAYSYPATKEDKASMLFKIRFEKDAAEAGEKNVIWSEPYLDEKGRLMMLATSPVFAPDGSHIACVRFELRVDNLLAPLIKATVKDPVHELTFITPAGDVLEIDSGRVHLLCDKNGNSFECRISADEAKGILEKIKGNHMQLTAVRVGNVDYVASAGKTQSMDGYILQMIKRSVISTHEHVDLSL